MAYLDIHCHLLWGLDDGCQSAEEALEAARALSAVGYSDAAPSPHARDEFASRDAALCDARRVELQALLDREAIPLRLHRGAENFLDEEFLDRAGRGEPRGLGSAQRYALVELPFRGRVPSLPELVFRLKVKGVTPILAHPERCEELVRDGRAEEAVRLGAALQLDLGALVGRYGKEPRRAAEKLLGAGLYAIAATDLHRPDGAREWIAEAHAVLSKKTGPGGLARLCAENPRRALAGEELS